MNDDVKNNQENPDAEKKLWTKPELSELGLENTRSGDIHPTEINTTAGPS